MRVIKCNGCGMKRVRIRRRGAERVKEGSFAEVYEQLMRRIRKVNELKVNSRLKSEGY